MFLLIREMGPDSLGREKQRMGKQNCCSLREKWVRTASGMVSMDLSIWDSQPWPPWAPEAAGYGTGKKSKSRRLLSDFKKYNLSAMRKGGLPRTGERCQVKELRTTEESCWAWLVDVKGSLCFEYEWLEYLHKLIKTSLVLNKLNQCWWINV